MQECTGGQQTAEALDLVRRAKAQGLPGTCDVTPHHLALTDEWIAGAQRFEDMFPCFLILHDGVGRGPPVQG